MPNDEETVKEDGQEDNRSKSAVAVLQRRYRDHKSKREAAGLNLQTSAAARDQTGGEEQHTPSPITPQIR